MPSNRKLDTRILPIFLLVNAVGCDNAEGTTEPAGSQHGVIEVCNGVDDNGDGQVDDGNPEGGAECVLGNSSLCGTGIERCEDGAIVCAPSREEICNGLDDDCNGEVDEGYEFNAYYRDNDGDGFGTDETVEACEKPDGYAVQEGDCNDNNPNVYPGAVEFCNDADDNCNGYPDEGVQKPIYYKDNDGDGFGGVTMTFACQAPTGFVEVAGDCNDFNAAMSPGATESCNDADDDCNGLTDDGLTLAHVFVDLDGDGFGGKSAVAKPHCLVNNTDAPFGYAVSHDDCDDSRSTVFPGAAELCDGVLNDCTKKVPDYQCPTKCEGVWPVQVGGDYGYPAIAQLDYDAEFEVVVQTGGTTYALNHDGTTLWTGPGTSYSHPALADFDLDGTMDVVATSSGVIRILGGLDGAVLATLNVPAAAPWFSASVFDVDNNGWPDLAPFGSGALPLLKLGSGMAITGTSTIDALSGESQFRLPPVTLADFNGDGISEFAAGSGSGNCQAQPVTCRGRFYVGNANGGLFNDPTWTSAVVPHFKVGGFPSTHAGEAMWGMVADIDHDGTAEVVQNFSDKPYVWRMNGNEHPLSGAFSYRRGIAPVNPDGTLTDGRLSGVDAAAIDIDNDGDYELVGHAEGGLSIKKAGAVMDGYPIPIGGSMPVIGDINRDNALDILWLGSNNAVNCVTLKGGTYDFRRVLTQGAIVTAGAPGIYPTNNYDPFEPNNKQTSVTPTQSQNPRGDFRAFDPRGLRDKYSPGAGWKRSLTALVGTKADEDWYWFEYTHGDIRITSHIPDKLLVDMDVFVYVPENNAWQYTCEAHVGGTGDSQLYFHPTISTGTCPAGINGTKGFLVRIKGHDPNVDFGPWPYTFSFYR